MSAQRLTLPMPRLGETMEEGTVAGWLVTPGAAFARGDALLEVETDKTLVEYPALGGGTLVEVLVAAGDVVTVGAPIAVIETEDAWEGIAPAQDKAKPAAEAKAEVAAADVVRNSGGGLRATPLARRMARQAGVALDSIPGTGRRGRIEADDVRKRLAASDAADALPVYLVHGFAGLGSNWAALRTQLQRAGHDTTAPDLPGHGGNPADATDPEALIQWLAADLAAHPQPVHLVGHSLGAYLAVKAALKHPARVARLTLIAPAGCGLEINGAFISGMAEHPAAGTLAHLMRLLGPKAATLETEALAAGLATDRLAPLAAAVAEGDVQRIDCIHPLRALAGQLPVSAIFGLHDRIIPRAHAFHLPPDVACHMIEAGHMPQWDAPDDVARIIARRS